MKLTRINKVRQTRGDLQIIMIIASFIFFLLVFVLIGISSFLVREKNTTDYLLASQNVPPWLVALSAVATNNSGFMFTGMIGFTYTYGLSAIWVMTGWIFGDFVSSFCIHRDLRIVSEKRSVLSFAGALSTWHGDNFRIFRAVSGILTIVFLGAYAAAQLSAGSKALHVLAGWDHYVGALLGAGIVFAYCVAGGIRASIWTDAAQSMVMIVAMGILVFSGISQSGGYEMLLTTLSGIDKNYLSLFPDNMGLPGISGTMLFLFGWFFGGIAVTGQPHIMIRFMSLKDPETLHRTRVYYYGWYIAFYALTITVGLLARAMLVRENVFDPELALILMSAQILPPILTGLMLSAIFAATISTADSLVLSCSASISSDLFQKYNISYGMTKTGTFLVITFAFLISVFGNRSVFQLVLMSWGVLGSAFAPLLFIYVLRRRVTETQAIITLFAGGLTAITWRLLELNYITYEVLPGFMTGILTGLFFTFINGFRNGNQNTQQKPA
jgi:sodium/proline symporter